MSFKNKSLKENYERISKPSLEEREGKEKRYVVTVDFYVWAEDDRSATQQAEESLDRINVDDNKASIVSIHEQPTGTTKSRKLNYLG